MEVVHPQNSGNEEIERRSRTKRMNLPNPCKIQKNRKTKMLVSEESRAGEPSGKITMSSGTGLNAYLRRKTLMMKHKHIGQGWTKEKDVQKKETTS